jgi:hypothetical protein
MDQGRGRKRKYPGYKTVNCCGVMFHNSCRFFMRSIWIWVVMAMGAVPEDSRDKEVMNLMKTLRKRHPNWNDEKMDKVAKEHVDMANRSRSESRDMVRVADAVSVDGRQETFPVAAYATKITVGSAMKTVFSEHAEFIGLPNNFLIPMIQDQFPSDERPSIRSVKHALAIERTRQFGPRKSMGHVAMAKKLLKDGGKTRSNEDLAKTISDALVKDGQRLPVMTSLKGTISRARQELTRETGEDFSVRSVKWMNKT